MPAIYIHVPFCRRRCAYCDFCSSVAAPETISAYADALIRNIRACAPLNLTAETVYFGGGTPSLVSAADMNKIMSAVRESFALPPSAEVSAEANPDSADYEKLAAWRDAGINRLSLGVQSCKDNELYRLGRLHNFSQAENAVKNARKAGFENISCDLMLGIPEQTPETALESVNRICDMGVCHVSAYMLKIEEGTPFDCDEIRSSLMSDDELSDMYLMAAEALEKRGLAQYEISNFSREGCQSRHNLTYWTLGEYLGFGPSAHSLFRGKRFFVPHDISGFINSEFQRIEIEDEHPDFLQEYVMLGLRLCKGIELDGLGEKAEKILPALEPLKRANLVKTGGGRLRLTRRGFLVSNGIIARLLEILEK